MPTLPIVPNLDKLENDRPRRLPGFEGRIIEFALERCEKALGPHYPKSSFAAYASENPISVVNALGRIAGILHPTIGMNQQRLLNESAIHRHSQRIEDESRLEAMTHRLTHDLHKRLGSMPIGHATSVAISPLSTTRRTTSILNSRGNFRRWSAMRRQSFRPPGEAY